ncbi:Acetamidase [Psilocybe cubensis]|uniref:Acetamidase n=2 Tax=Psilocybe cubensis TaxID=181762 RepID=A0ACB8GW10_PSICU|nr:Acetamidase [Psilocybe cubensis]KAH9479411.1 Acetamidase [Psilocybe cubensis]
MFGESSHSETVQLPKWRRLCAQKQKSLHDSVPSDWFIPRLPLQGHPNVLDVPEKCGLLTERELMITETTDVGLILAKLRAAEWSSVETTTAFYKRAVLAHQLTNCLTEIFVDSALERARHLDDVLRNTGKPVGPLHGLPVSLKDQFTMKGLETVMGYVSGIGKYADKDSVIVEILYRCGAVPFVRTNVPQTLMWGETFNNVFGRTLNPYNRSLTPGGSSGGEGALLAMKGSPLGVGTDIGGSLRIPSAFCGLYTLRPSYARLPYYGAANALNGQESISSVLGPMANSLSGLKEFMTAIIGAKPWDLDPVNIRKPWNEEEWNLSEHGGIGGHLCFAIMWDNGVVRPHPPLIRAMQMTKEALEKAGHRVIDWECHRHIEIYKNAETIFVADGSHDYMTECEKSGEPLIRTMVPSEDEEAAVGYEFEPPYPFVKALVGDSPEHLKAYELWKLHEEKRELRKSHLDHWQSTVSRTGTGRPVDAIISPAVAYTAVPHGLNTDSFYTTLCNAMDYTTSVFPVTRVDPKVDIPKEPHEFYNHEDEAIYKLYRTDLFDGCPVGLQLIGKTLEEEAVMRMTFIVDDALKQSIVG